MYICFSIKLICINNFHILSIYLSFLFRHFVFDNIPESHFMQECLHRWEHWLLLLKMMSNLTIRWIYKTFRLICTKTGLVKPGLSLKPGFTKPRLTLNLNLITFFELGLVRLGLKSENRWKSCKQILFLT